MSFSKFGREAEYMSGLFLQTHNWSIFFSNGSRGPADIIATKNNIMLLIQVKASTKIPKIKGYEVQRLLEFSNKILHGFPIISLVHPNIKSDFTNDSVPLGNYLLNFFLLPRWESITYLL